MLIITHTYTHVYTRLHTVQQQKRRFGPKTQVRMDAIFHFRDVPSSTPMSVFIHTYQRYEQTVGTNESIIGQMKDLAKMELDAETLSSYCASRVLNRFQQYILVNYIGKMSHAIYTHHSTTHSDDVRFRHVFAERYVARANMCITSGSLDYWFRVVYSALMRERSSTIIAIQYLTIIDHVYGYLELIDRKIYTARMLGTPGAASPVTGGSSLVDYVMRMAEVGSESIAWPIFVERVLGILYRSMTSWPVAALPTGAPPGDKTGSTMDTRIIAMLMMLIRDEDNRDMVCDILQLINTVVGSGLLGTCTQQMDILQASVDMDVIANLPNHAVGQDKINIQLEVAFLFAYVLENENTDVSSLSFGCIEAMCKDMAIHYDIDNIGIVTRFISAVSKCFPGIHHDPKQILVAIAMLVEENEEFALEDETHLILECILSLLESSAGSDHPFACQKDVFQAVVSNYRILCGTQQSRMLMMLIVYEFLKMGYGRPELGYAHTLKMSGYMNMAREDMDILNQDMYRTIRYTYLSTSLHDKCVEVVLDHAHTYPTHMLADVMDIVFN